MSFDPVPDADAIDCVPSFDFGAATQASLNPSPVPGGTVRTAPTFALTAIYFGRTGYQIRISRG